MATSRLQAEAPRGLVKTRQTDNRQRLRIRPGRLARPAFDRPTSDKPDPSDDTIGLADPCFRPGEGEKMAEWPWDARPEGAPRVRWIPA